MSKPSYASVVRDDALWMDSICIVAHVKLARLALGRLSAVAGWRDCAMWVDASSELSV
jgi:hypothetical protein